MPRLACGKIKPLRAMSRPGSGCARSNPSILSRFHTFVLNPWSSAAGRQAGERKRT
jgi:hypothetical protein